LTQDDSPFEALPMLAEVIKLKDTSMMSLELSVLDHAMTPVVSNV